MFKILCKIWRFILKLFKMIIDGIMEIIGVVLKAVMSLVSSIWKSIFGGSGIGLGGLIMLGLLGFGAWKMYGVYSDKKKEEAEMEKEIALAKIRNGEYSIG